MLSGEVYNKSNNNVSAGGRIFPPRQTITVTLSDKMWREVRGKRKLEVVSSDHLEVFGVEPEESNKVENEEVSCPYCNEYSGTTQRGLTMHIRSKHPDKVE